MSLIVVLCILRSIEAAAAVGDAFADTIEAVAWALNARKNRCGTIFSANLLGSAVEADRCWRCNDDGRRDERNDGRELHDDD